MGIFKSISNGYKFKYHENSIKIKKKPSLKGAILKFNDQSYQFLEKEVRILPSKKKQIIIKKRSDRIYLLNSEKEKILKIKSFQKIFILKFFKDPPDLILYLIAGIYYSL